MRRPILTERRHSQTVDVDTLDLGMALAASADESYLVALRVA